MNVDDYGELPSEEQTHFYKCETCGLMVEIRIIDDVVFHTDHKQRPDFSSRAIPLNIAASDGNAYAQELLAGVYAGGEEGARYPKDRRQAAYIYSAFFMLLASASREIIQQLCDGILRLPL